MAKEEYTEAELAKARDVILAYEAAQAEKARKEAEEAAAPKKFKAGRWICMKECYHGGRIWRPGDTAEWKKASEAPITGGYVHHFQPEA